MTDEENYEVLEFLSTIPDPRIDRCKKYSLESILFIALIGMLCGADSAREMVEFADGNEIGEKEPRRRKERKQGDSNRWQDIVWLYWK